MGRLKPNILTVFFFLMWICWSLLLKYKDWDFLGWKKKLKGEKNRKEGIEHLREKGKLEECKLRRKNEGIWGVSFIQGCLILLAWNAVSKSVDAHMFAFKAMGLKSRDL